MAIGYLATVAAGEDDPHYEIRELAEGAYIVNLQAGSWDEATALQQKAEAEIAGREAVLAAGLDEDQKHYLALVCSEMMRRGYKEDELHYMIVKSGFLSALTMFPEQQMHYSISDAVDEIIFTASRG